MKAQWLNKRGKLTKQLPSSKSWNLTIKYAKWFVLESKKKEKIGQEKKKFFFGLEDWCWDLGAGRRYRWEVKVYPKKKKSSKGNKGFFCGWVFEMEKMKFCCYVFGFWVFKYKWASFLFYLEYKRPKRLKLKRPKTKGF